MIKEGIRLPGNRSEGTIFQTEMERATGGDKTCGLVPACWHVCERMYFLWPVSAGQAGLFTA